MADGPTAEPVLAPAATYVPGQTYWGSNQYIEYIAGDLPIIISAPHGGYLTPKEIPNRRYGERERDPNSQEYTRAVVDYIVQRTGHYPHVIINHLHRIKLDANRDIREAAQGNPWAEQAWYEFHGFIDQAKATVESQWGRGHYFDFHSMGHREAWVEFGYLLADGNLRHSDEELNSPDYWSGSSLRSLANSPGVYFPEIIRGETSLGGLMQSHGYKTVPSPAYPDPAGGTYYIGDYNITRHGSRDGGAIDGTQVETYRRLVKDGELDAYAQALADSILRFIEIHYSFRSLELPFAYYLPLIMRGR
jgi:hypothetical protein